MVSQDSLTGVRFTNHAQARLAVFARLLEVRKRIAVPGPSPRSHAELSPWSRRDVVLKLGPVKSGVRSTGSVRPVGALRQTMVLQSLFPALYQPISPENH